MWLSPKFKNIANVALLNIVHRINRIRTRTEKILSQYITKRADKTQALKCRKLKIVWYKLHKWSPCLHVYTQPNLYVFF